MERIIRVLVVVLTVMVLSACGSGGGDGAIAVWETECSSPDLDVTGTWLITETSVSDNCGEPSVPKAYSILFTQTGNAVTAEVPGSSLNVSGQICGSKISWSGSYPEDYGTTTMNSWSATFLSDGNSLKGSDAWGWTDGSSSCSGSADFTGSRQSGGTPPAAPSSLSATATSSSAVVLTWMDNSTDETGFKIERSTSSSTGFAPIFSTSMNAETYTDNSVSASTTYYYKVRAYNIAGDSVYSNTATAIVPATSTILPPAPSGLSATALSSSSIQVSWTDNSANETGFYLERAVSSCTGSFSPIASLGADIKGYTNNGLGASQTYCYRARAYNSAGNSEYSNTGSATTQSSPTYTLTVNKTGSGAGTGVVTGTGINCGVGSSDCTETYTSGTSVTLSAGSVGGSALGSWTGCNSTSGATCTVTMNSSKTVTATFNSTSTITLADIPSPDTDGAYTLSWTATGQASSAWYIQESANTSFSTYTAYTSTDSTSPYTRDFSGKADGTYCYRVALSSSSTFSEPKCVTVARPTTAVLRIVNNSRYDIIDLRLNGTQKLNYPSVVLAGKSADFTYSSSSAVSIEGGVGFYNTNTTRNIWFTYSGSTNVTVGQVTTETFDAVTIAQLLSGFTTARNWDGDYYCYSCPTLAHMARFRFASSGGWILYDDGAQESTGSVTLVSWPNYSSIVTFRLCSTCANIDLEFPFASFLYKNGPAGWSVIKYVAQ